MPRLPSWTSSRHPSTRMRRRKSSRRSRSRTGTSGPSPWRRRPESGGRSIHGEGAATYLVQDRRGPVQRRGPELAGKLRGHGDRRGGRIRDGRRRTPSVYGGRSGFMNVVTKSGGNEFHGEGPVLLYGRRSSSRCCRPTSSWPPSGWPIRPSPLQLRRVGHAGRADLQGQALVLRELQVHFAQERDVDFIPDDDRRGTYGPYDQSETRPNFFGKLTFQVSQESEAVLDVHLRGRQDPAILYGARL